MKSWKNQLKKEFDMAAPKLKDEVRNAPIVVTRQETESTATKNDRSLFRRRTLTGTAFAAFALVLVFAFIGVFKLLTPAVTPEPTSYVFALEINPAVAFVTDKDGVVKSVNALNDDADVVLSDEATLNGIKNKPLSEALVAYTDCAVKLGYLDITATSNAVRLSGSKDADENLTSNASESLKNYFKEKGIYAVVVESLLDVKDFSERLGVNETDDLAELTDSLGKLPEYYGERMSPDAGAEELQNLYKKYVVGMQTLELVRSELLENINAVIINAQKLYQLSQLNLKIIHNKENPYYPIPMDYWRLKKIPDLTYTEEFAKLMEETETLLDEYKNKFGKNIGSLDELKDAVDVYSSLSGVNFEEVFHSLTLEDFQTSAKKYVGMLRNVGCDVTALEPLLNAPTTAQEYIAQFQTLLGSLFQSRTERFKDVYEQPRDAIIEEDYESFVNGIIEEYGSLENFWNKK